VDVQTSLKGEPFGYAHPAYADSLAEWGTPRSLPRCQGWILERVIPSTASRDAMGCYPLFSCRDWSQLSGDLHALGGELVSLSIVTDPFGDYTPADLSNCFPDVARPYKEHFVVDLSRPAKEFVHAHHQRSARQALGRLTVERCDNPALYLDEWVGFYSTLAARHEIKGLTAFSRESFAKQLAVPGLVMLRATDATGRGVGQTLWYVHNGVGYYHLGAYSDEGYAVRASFALFRHALDYFAALGLGWLDLGAGAGATGDGADGLTRFKSGWATSTRTAYFCGRVFDREKYDQITRARGISAANYFPSYRAGEFA